MKKARNYPKDAGDTFIAHFRRYTETYTKKDFRVMKQALRRYEEFLSLHDIRDTSDLTPETAQKFADYLMAKSKGYGASSTWSRFKKATKNALEAGVIRIDPCRNIRCSSGGDSLVKEILSEEEIVKLTTTHYRNENEHIRKAFIFCLYTGIRFCDIRLLHWHNIDMQNMFVSFRQEKTKGSSGKSYVCVPLREDMIKLLNGIPHQSRGPVFCLPSHTTCLKHLKKWTEEAHISKHITWHMARHRNLSYSLKTNRLQN